MENNINTRLYYFKTKSAFDAKVRSNSIPDSAIVFIEQTKQVYTHGLLWDGSDVSLAIAKIELKIKEAGNGLTDGQVLGKINGKDFLFNRDNNLNINNYTAGEGISITNNQISNKFASSDSIGGIKLGYNSDSLLKRYGVKLDNYNRAFVEVPWENPGGSNPDGKNGGTWELIFCKSDTQPKTPANGTADLSMPADSNIVWDHSAPNSGTIWMTSRFITGEGIYNNWQTPWRISGPDGRAGEDGEGIEFVYIGTASSQLDSQLVENLNRQWPNGSLGTKKFLDDDFVPLDWNDNPSGIDSSHKYEWAAVRYSNKADSNYKWTRFQGPFLWSKWGENGMDGDGIEYIYWAGPRNGEPQNPANWTNDSGFQTQPEYIRSGSGWQDDPIDLRKSIYGPGSIQLVSIRKKHDNIWGAYSDPVLWTSYPYDGTTGNDGIVADLDNDMMAVSLKANNTNYAFLQTAKVHLYAGINEVTDTRTDTIKYVYRTDSGNTEVSSATYSNYLSMDSSTHTLTVNMAEGAVDFSNGSNIVVIIECSGKVNNATVTRTCALYINGFSFGTDGASYRLSVSHSQIRRNKNLELAPTEIECKCVKTSGEDDISEWDATTIESNTTLSGGHFEIWYRKDEELSESKLTTATIQTSGTADKIIVYLYYIDSSNNLWLVDRETIFVISDGIDGIDGLNAVVYQIHPVSTTVRKLKVPRVGSDPYDGAGGGVFFYITRTEGTNTVKLVNEDLVTYDLTIEASICGVPRIPSYEDINTPGTQTWYPEEPWKCRVWTSNPVVWSDEEPFTQITLKCGDVTIASAIVPIIIPGEDGNDAVQPLKYQITRTRVWTQNPDPAYNDGTEVESDGITYADIVYYGQGVYLCVKAGTTQVPGDGNEWLEFNLEGNAVFNYLLANYINAKGINVKEIVVTDNNDKPVAGMLSGSAIPAEITSSITGFNTSNATTNGVRLFAGLPGIGGNIVDTAWNVRENGDMYVGKNGSGRSNQFLADGSGHVANGNISWNSNGDVTINGANINYNSKITDIPGSNAFPNVILINKMQYGNNVRLLPDNNIVYVTFTIIKNGFFLKTGMLTFTHTPNFTPQNNSILGSEIINQLRAQNTVNSNFTTYFGNSSNYIFKNGEQVYVCALDPYIYNLNYVKDINDNNINVMEWTEYVQPTTFSWQN